ncbi:MAG: cytochrome C oxidase subunit I, partial [Burkholderiales bacterium]
SMSYSASNDSTPAGTEAGRSRGRRVALAILAVCAAPTLAAWFAYFVWQPQTRLNYGELIEVHALPEREMQWRDGRPFEFSQLRGKWLILQVDSGSCAEACRKKLLYMRQARLAQGKDAERIERVWILSDSVSPDPAVLRDYPGMNIVRATGSAPLARFPAARTPVDHIYLIDPLGNLMLRFPGDPDARRMTRDLARLLKASRIG